MHKDCSEFVLSGDLLYSVWLCNTVLQSVGMLNCRLPRYSNIDFYEKGPHIFFLLGPSVRIIIRSECIIDTRNLAVIRRG